MNDKPLFVQLMEMIEDNILADVYTTGGLIMSSTQIVKLYNVNPATAMHALSELVDGGVLVKDRGIGMRVTENAKAIIAKRREHELLNVLLRQLIDEAEKLGISKEELRRRIT